MAVGQRARFILAVLSEYQTVAAMRDLAQALAHEAFHATVIHDE